MYVYNYMFYLKLLCFFWSATQSDTALCQLSQKLVTLGMTPHQQSSYRQSFILYLPPKGKGVRKDHPLLLLGYLRWAPRHCGPGSIPQQFPVSSRPAGSQNTAQDPWRGVKVAGKGILKGKFQKIKLEPLTVQEKVIKDSLKDSSGINIMITNTILNQKYMCQSKVNHLN